MRHRGGSSDAAVYRLGGSSHWGLVAWTPLTFTLVRTNTCTQSRKRFKALSPVCYTLRGWRIEDAKQRITVGLASTVSRRTQLSPIMSYTFRHNRRWPTTGGFGIYFG